MKESIAHLLRMRSGRPRHQTQSPKTNYDMQPPVSLQEEVQTNAHQQEASPLTAPQE